jgi:hypothetical protein
LKLEVFQGSGVCKTTPPTPDEMGEGGSQGKFKKKMQMLIKPFECYKHYSLGGILKVNLFYVVKN